MTVPKVLSSEPCCRFERQPPASSQLREYSAIFAVLLPIYSGSRGFQYRTALPKDNVDERCVWMTALAWQLLTDYQGLLMLSLVALSLFNVSVLLAPTKFISALLELVPIPLSARLTLLWAAIINVAVSVGFERWIAQVVADMVGMFVSQHEGRRRIKDNRVYRAVDRE